MYWVRRCLLLELKLFRYVYVLFLDRRTGISCLSQTYFPSSSLPCSTRILVKSPAKTVYILLFCNSLIASVLGHCRAFVSHPLSPGYHCFGRSNAIPCGIVGLPTPGLHDTIYRRTHWRLAKRTPTRSQCIVQLSDSRAELR